MDFTRLTVGEKIAGASGIALILIMFIFKWFGLEFNTDLGGLGLSAEGSRNAWGSYGFIDIVLFITVVAAVSLALISASDSEVGLPVAASAIVAGLGTLSVVLVIISIISPPDFGLDLSGTGVEHTRKIGVWLGLLAAIGVAYGGWRAMQEEGTSVGGEADRLRGEPTERPGTGPERPDAGPPPPPSSPPPTSPSQAP
jgi:hypothetical protein